MELLRLKNVTKRFGVGRTGVVALRGVNVRVTRGDIVLIMGPSGSGKTTLLTIAGGLLKPTSGTVTLGGTNITRATEQSLPALRLKHLGFVFQSFNLLSALSAEHNVAVPFVLAGHTFAEAREKSQVLLKKLGLGKRMHALPAELSGGEKQRVAIARALINDPKIILADEPTANLDSHIGHEVMQLLCTIACTERRAVIIVSHDERLRDVAKRVITIEDGRLTKTERGGHAKNCTMAHLAKS